MTDLRTVLTMGARLAATLLLAVAVFVTTIDPSDAQSRRNKNETKSSGSKTISVKIQKQVIEIQEILEAGRNQEAISKLRGLGAMGEMPKYDQAVLNQLYAQAYIDQENYEEGVKYLERVISLGRDELPPEQISQMQMNVGQIYIAIGAQKDGATAQNYFKKGIATLEQWFKENPNARPDAYAILANAYLGVEPPNYKRAITWMEKAIAKAKELGEEPKEGWYRNVAGLYIEIEQVSKALPLMELLIKKYPKREYWMQLAFVYGELNREKEQFATLEAAHRQGMLTKGNEQIYLAQLYIQNEIPIRGAQIVEAGLDKGVIEKKANHYRLLADAYYTAKELDQAIKWYNVAGQESKNGQAHFFLCQIFMQQEEWEKASSACESSIRKDGSAPRDQRMSMISNAHYNLGIAYFYSSKCKDAKRAFTNATNYPAQRSGANQWIDRINRSGCR